MQGSATDSIAITWQSFIDSCLICSTLSWLLSESRSFHTLLKTLSDQFLYPKFLISSFMYESWKCVDFVFQFHLLNILLKEKHTPWTRTKTNAQQNISYTILLLSAITLRGGGIWPQPHHTRWGCYRFINK